MSGTQLPMFAPESAWRGPDMSTLPDWRGAKRIGFDVETKDPQLKKMGPGVRRRNSKMVGYSFAIEGGPKHYIPFDHAGGDNVDREAALRYLREQTKSFNGELVGAKLSYDLDWAQEYGADFSSVSWFRDVQVAEPVIDELQYSYSLDTLLEKYGLPLKSEDKLREAAGAYSQPTGKKGKGRQELNPKADLWRLPARFVGEYGEADAELPLRLLRLQEERLAAEGLESIFDLESEVLPVLVKLRRRGVAIDVNHLAKVRAWAIDQERLVLDEVHRLTGHQVGVGNVWKADALAPALESIGITVPKKKDKYSIDKFMLERIEHPVGENLAMARKYSKLGQFGDSVSSHMVNGRIHGTFNQSAVSDDDDVGATSGARYGRMSSSDPNMQQQPSRDDYADFWRSIYIPEPGMIWGCLDYSQQEPRVCTHFAEKAGLRGAKAMGEKYRTDPKTDNHQSMADICSIPRKAAKAIYLGLCYGMGGAKMSRDLGLPTAIKELRNGRRIEVAGPECQAFIDKFDSSAPFVRLLSDMCKETAEGRGFLRTLLGRHCHFPKDSAGNYDWTHKALNRLIQGSAADQTKAALVAVDKAGYYIQLQVHDELDGSFETTKQALECAEIMENIVQLTVPSRVDVECGESWGQITDVAA